MTKKKYVCNEKKTIKVSETCLVLSILIETKFFNLDNQKKVVCTNHKIKLNFAQNDNKVALHTQL